MDTSAILVAIVAAIGTILAAWINSNKNVTPKLSISPLLISFENLNNLNDTLNDMFTRTTADRFLMLISDNDGSGYQYVSGIFEHHAIKNIENFNLSVGAVNKYIKLDTDIYYKKLIEDVRKNSLVKYTTSKMEDSMLKSIYLYEKITYSNVYFLYDIEIENEGKTSVTTLFCSIAKHEDSPFTPNDELVMRTVVDKIKNSILSNE